MTTKDNDLNEHGLDREELGELPPPIGVRGIRLRGGS
jgi:hypothetical protein